MKDLIKLQNTTAYNLLTLIRNFVFPIKNLILEHDKKLNELHSLVIAISYREVKEKESLDENIKYLVNFKNPEIYFGNSLLPATISKYKGPTRKHIPRVFVKWDNGFTSVIERNKLNIYIAK